jgi:preprotein translocase subunit SecG
MLTALLLLASVTGFIKSLLMFFFVLCALLLIIVILLQEPKGGGLASAFGGAGAETFGVKTGGVNKFTAILASVYMLLAILYAAIPHDRPLAASELGDPAGVTGVEEPGEPPVDEGGGEETPGG